MIPITCGLEELPVSLEKEDPMSQEVSHLPGPHRGMALRTWLCRGLISPRGSEESAPCLELASPGELSSPPSLPGVQSPGDSPRGKRKLQNCCC